MPLRLTDGKIKVLVADDDELFLESLRALVDGQPELSVVAAARNGPEAEGRAGAGARRAPRRHARLSL
jgi:DNA-binding NarL/FixJ family response regulator